MTQKIRKIYPAKAQVSALEMNCIALAEPDIQEWDNGVEYKAKTVVKVENLNNGKVIDLVIWKNFNVHKGDTIHTVGKLEQTGKAFIGWSEYTTIIKRA